MTTCVRAISANSQPTAELEPLAPDVRLRRHRELCRAVGSESTNVALRPGPVVWNLAPMPNSLSRRVQWVRGLVLDASGARRRGCSASGRWHSGSLAPRAVNRL